MAREKLIAFRFGTRAELNASTAQWSEGEAGYIKDERTLIIADRDGTTDEQDFAEYKEEGKTPAMENEVSFFAASSDGAVTAKHVQGELADTDVPSSIRYAYLGTGVTSIGVEALAQGTLKKVVIPDSVTNIDTTAFQFSGLEEVTIPSSVLAIGGSAFGDSASLATAYLYVDRLALGLNVFEYTASPLTIHARANDSTWTEGTGQSIGGNTNVTVIKDL